MNRPYSLLSATILTSSAFAIGVTMSVQNVVCSTPTVFTFDPASIKWGACSHAHARSLIGQGVVNLIFPNVLLPDCKVNEPASHGFVWRYALLQLSMHNYGHEEHQEYGAHGSVPSYR